MWFLSGPLSPLFLAQLKIDRYKSFCCLILSNSLALGISSCFFVLPWWMFFSCLSQKDDCFSFFLSSLSLMSFSSSK